MALYASALNSSNGTSLGGLTQTYNSAANKLNGVCGSSYAQNAQASTSSSSRMNAGVPRASLLVVLGVLFAAVLCGN